MNYFRNNKILVWALIALFALNIAALSTILYHVYFGEDADTSQVEAPAFMKDRMQMNDRQWRTFRDQHHRFRQDSRELFQEMHNLQGEMLNEITSDAPDREKLDELAVEYGTMHTRLKQRMIDHMLEMKENISPEQEQMLNRFLHDLMKKEGFGPPPGRGAGHRHRHGRAWQ